MVICAKTPAICAAARGEPIPGYTFRDGAYRPNEPWREGQPRATGLQQPFPRMKSIEENPLTPAKLKLGKLLYFDPILSGENCAWLAMTQSCSPIWRTVVMAGGARSRRPAATSSTPLWRTSA